MRTWGNGRPLHCAGRRRCGQAAGWQMRLCRIAGQAAGNTLGRKVRQDNLGRRSDDLISARLACLCS